MNRAAAVLIVLAVLSSVAVGAIGAQPESGVPDYKQIPGVTSGEIKAIEDLKSKRNSLTYAYLPETDSFTDASGRLTGFTVYVAELLSGMFGIEFELTFCEDWPELKSGIDNAALDFAGVFTPTPERAGSYYMSIPIAGRAIKLYTLDTRTDIQSESDVNGLSVGFLDGTINESEVRDRYPELSFQAVTVSSFTQAVELLRAGAIDAFAADGTSDVRLDAFLKSRDFFPLVYSPVSITTSQKELQPFISVIDKFIQSGGNDTFIELNERGEYDYITYKLHKSFTAEERSYIENMVLRGTPVDIGLQHDAYPVSFFNVNDGEFQGVALDILTEITKLTGLEFAHVTTTTDTPIATILAKLKSGEISMMTQLLKVESRKNDYLWNATPYLRTKYALLSKTDMPDLEIYQVLFVPVGTVYMTAHEEMFENWFPRHENQVIYETTDDAFDALDRGEIDLLMLSENMLLTQTNYREKPGFKINISFNKTLDSFFGFNKNERILLSIIDKSMEHIDLEKIGNRWMNRVFDYSKKISDMRSMYLSMFTMSLVVVLAVVSMMFVSNRRMGKELAGHTTTLSAIYSSIPDTVFCKDKNGAFTSCNPSFERQTGYKEANLIGKTYEEVLTGARTDNDMLYKETDRKVLQNGTREVMLDEVTYPDGTTKIVEILKAPLVQNGAIVGLLGIGRDVTEREINNIRLRIARESLQMVLDSLPMPIRIVDLASLNIVYANDSLAELLEYSTHDELCGKHITALLPEMLRDGTPSIERVYEIKDAVEPISVEIEYRTRSGGIIDTLVVARKIDYNGAPSSIGIIKDLSAEKERARVLLEAAEREKEASRAKSMFLANMSHEIRTPMNGILGMTDLLLGERLEGRQLQYVRDIKSSAESLLGIINDILDLSKIGEGRLQITPADIDLSNLIRNIVSMMRFSAQNKGLQFIDDVRIKTPEYVRVDDLRLNQIILNVLSNAIKFTKEGYVKLSVEIRGGEIAIAVSDTGIGIKPEDLPLIFTAFEQVDKKKNRNIIGTGLGLSISRSLTELMGGQISVESVYGKGTTFYITIPYVEGDESAAEQVDTGEKYIYAPTARVLLVDDIQTNLTVGTGLLRLCGITPDVAMSGSESIEMVRQNEYDIVFMDHMMPEMDGIEAMEHIRALGDEYSALPIIALTANAVNESKDLLLSSGMDDFISKPINKGEMMNMLLKWLPAEKVSVSVPDGTQDAALALTEALERAMSIDGLDIKLALNRIGGACDVLEDSIRYVAYSINDQLKKMDSLLSNDDLKGFAIEAHGLKGALSNIGAMLHAEQAAGLEIASKAENKPLCISKFAAFNDEMNSFAQKLRAVFPKAAVKNMSAGQPEFLRTKINEALEALESFEALEAKAALAALCKYSFGAEKDMLISEAAAALDAYNYDKSAEFLSKISC